MAIVAIRFREILQDSQELGDDEHMVSRVFFSIAAGERGWADLEVQVRQAVGARYTAAPLEVTLPAGYDGPMHYERFRDCVEAYYRRRGVMVTGPTAGTIRMRNNKLVAADHCSFESG